MPTDAPIRDDYGGELYSRIVKDLREALTTEELAKIVGIHSRQVQNWAAGRNRPQGENRDRLLGIQYLVQQLGEVYQPEGVDIWLHAPHREFGGARPIDLLAGGEYRRVLAAAERLLDGTPS